MARRMAAILGRTAARLNDSTGPTDNGRITSVCRQRQTRCVLEMGIARMKMYTYVNFPGTCAEAFRFYEKHLGGKPGMMTTHGEAPDQTRVKADWKNAVLHARMSVGETQLLGADIPNAQPMRSAYLTLLVDSDAEAERIYATLSEGGEVFMPLQETFFATRFGQLRDRFGLNWMIMREREA